MKLIQTINTCTQKVPANALINLGTIDRRVCSRDRCGIPTFNNSQDAITLNWVGYYKIDVNITLESAEAVPVAISLLSNGEVVDAASINETFVGGDVKTLSISKIVRVERGCCPCKKPVETLKLQLLNIGNEEVKILSLNFSAIKVE